MSPEEKAVLVVERFKARIPEVRERYQAWERGHFQDGKLDGRRIYDLERFEKDLFALAHEFVLQEVLPEDIVPLVGEGDEFKAIDAYLENDSKYGRWKLFRWDPRDKGWWEADIMRVEGTREIQMIWLAPKGA